MCRLLAYKGAPVPLETLISKPENSLIFQARDASFHPGCPDKRNIRVNGDGFGVAWYHMNKVQEGSCMVKYATPAWSSPNLLNLAKFIESGLLFAHVRAASDGSALIGRVNYENCHPFQYKRYTFMHNGGLSGFNVAKRTLLDHLDDPLYAQVEGSTDSEVCFAIFLRLLDDIDRQLTASELGQALAKTITFLLHTVSECHSRIAGAPPVPPSSLNFCVTDGRHMVATRYRNHHTQEPPSLYYITGSAFAVDSTKGTLRPVRHEPPGAIIISSEPLSRSADELWHLVPRNHMVVVSGHTEDVSQVQAVEVVPLQCDPSDAPVAGPPLHQHLAQLLDNPYLVSPRINPEPGSKRRHLQEIQLAALAAVPRHAGAAAHRGDEPCLA